MANYQDIGTVLTPEEARDILRTQMLIEAGALTPEQLVGGSYRYMGGQTQRPGQMPRDTALRGMDFTGVAGGMYNAVQGDPNANLHQIPGIADIDRQLNAMDNGTVVRMAVKKLQDLGPQAQQMYPDELNKVNQWMTTASQAPIARAEDVIPEGTPEPAVDPSNTPRARATQLMTDLNSRFGDLQHGSLQERYNNYQDATNAALSIISGLSSSGDPMDANTAALFSSAVSPMLQAQMKGIEFAQKYGNDATNNAIQWASVQMSGSAALRNAATAEARLGLDQYRLNALEIPQLGLQVRKLEEVDIPAQRWRETNDLMNLAFNDMTNQMRQELDLAKLGESVSQFETNRQDEARKAMIELQKGYTEFLGTNARAIANVAISAGSQFIEMLPNIISPSMEDKYLPGSAPGGAFDYMAKTAGYNYTPKTYGDTIVGQFDPFAPVGQLQNSVAGIEAQYPHPTMNDLAPERYSPGAEYLAQGQQPYTPSPLVSGFLGMGGDY